MKIYKFANISARSFPTIADLNNPWIFQDDVAAVISVTPRFDANIVKQIQTKGIEFHHFPLEEEIDDIGWDNVKKAVKVLLQLNIQGKRMIVHCDFGQHRSRLVIEAFYFALFGEHFVDEYKGYDNHLIYNSKTQHLPDLQHIEDELKNINTYEKEFWSKKLALSDAGADCGGVR